MVGEYLRGSSVVAVKTHMRTWRTEPVQVNFINLFTLSE